MRKLFFLFSALVIFTSGLTSARAELLDRKYTFIIGGGMGYQMPANSALDGLYGGGIDYYVKTGFGIASHFALIAEIAESRYGSAEGYKDLDTRSYLFRYLAGGVRYNFVAGAYIIPYVEGLVGVTRFRHAEYVDEINSLVRNDNFPIGFATFGTEFFIGPNWCVEGSIELYRVFADVYLQPALKTDEERTPPGKYVRPVGFQMRVGFLIFM